MANQIQFGASHCKKTCTQATLQKSGQRDVACCGTNREFPLQRCFYLLKLQISAKSRPTTIIATAFKTAFKKAFKTATALTNNFKIEHKK